MAFYAHHPFFATPRSASPAPSAHGHPHPHSFHHSHNPFAGHPRHSFAPHHYHPEPAAPSYDLDEEERLAYAHLQSIQRRREAEQAAIQREASIRHQAQVRAQEQREAAIAQALATERRREAAIQHAIAVEQYKRDQAQKAKDVREKAIRAALIEREQAMQQQIRRREKEAEERRRYAQAVELARMREIKAREHAKAKEEQYYNQLMAKRNACARRCAAHAPQAAKEEPKEKEAKDEGLEALNSLFGSLFGVRFSDKPSSEVAQAAKKVEKPAPITPSAPAATETKQSTSTDAAKADQEAFPEAINDILSHFLGVRVEPTSDKSTDTAATTPAPGENQVPEGLNELLSQFGLVFEPDTIENTDANKTASASTSAPADKSTAGPAEVADPPEAPLPSTSSPVSSSTKTEPENKTKTSAEQTPLTAFLDGAAHLPPFVRDILGNVELAFKEQAAQHKQQEKKDTDVKVDGKGKGVAAGEKKAPAPAPTSAPATASTNTASTPAESTSTSSASSASSIQALDNIAHDLYLATESFTFPSSLSFSTAPSFDSAPALLFNRANSGYHAQTNTLLQLLLAADGVSSAGDKEVRRKRKEVVRLVEGEIERLERKRDEVWADVKAKRERGEEVEGGADERIWSGSESGSSKAASVVDEEEEMTRMVEDADEEVKGFEVEHVEDKESTASVTDDKADSAPASAVPAATVNRSSTTSVDLESTENNSSDAPKTFADAAKVSHREIRQDRNGDVGGKEEGYELL